MRVWFNKTFSSLHSALQLLKEGDSERRYELVVSSGNPYALAALYADEFHVEPRSLSGGDYVDWCLDFCTSHDIRIFVPGKEAALISASRSRFDARGTRVLTCAGAGTLATIHDKARFYEVMERDAVPPPEWVLCDSFARFEESYALLAARHAAVCVKPAVGVYGIGFRRIRTDRSAYQIFSGGHQYEIDLQSLRAMLRERDSFSRMLVMEYLEGREYSADCIADHGTLQCAIARCKPRSLGEGQVIDARQDIQDACARVVARFELNGYCNIQFRDGRAGLRILEVNPRISGGIAMACLAGPNLPYLGLAGFDRGYAALRIPPVVTGLRLAELNVATLLP